MEEIDDQLTRDLRGRSSFLEKLIVCEQSNWCESVELVEWCELQIAQLVHQNPVNQLSIRIQKQQSPESTPRIESAGRPRAVMKRRGRGVREVEKERCRLLVFSTHLGPISRRCRGTDPFQFLPRLFARSLIRKLIPTGVLKGSLLNGDCKSKEGFKNNERFNSRSCGMDRDMDP